MNPYHIWIKNISYKAVDLEMAEPDFIHPRQPSGFCFTVRSWVPDRKNPDVPIKIGMRWESFYDLPEDEFYKFVHRAIREFEMHEVDEFFLINGVRVFDPHKDDKKAV